MAHRTAPRIPPRRRAALAAALALAGLLAPATPAGAASFPLPEGDDAVVGRLQRVLAHEEDTLLDIARRFDLGLTELTEANPEVDVWLPGEGTPVIVPTRFVLPAGEREGIVVNVAEMRLYYYPPPETPWERRTVVTHPVGIGRVGLETPLGTYTVRDKIRDPSWTVPSSLAADYRAQGVQFQAIVPPGPDNPLGAFALVLDAPGYFIHGTNRPWSIGMGVSRGCVRLYPEDILSLFPAVPQGTPVRIVDEPYKLGREAGVWYLEAHPADAEMPDGMPPPAADLMLRRGIEPLAPAAGAARAALLRPLGLPRPITPRRPPPT